MQQLVWQSANLPSVLEHQVSYSAGFCKQSATKCTQLIFVIIVLAMKLAYLLNRINNMTSRLQPPPNKPVWESNWTRTQPLKSPGSQLFTAAVAQICKRNAVKLLQDKSLSFVYVLISASTHIPTLNTFNLPLNHLFFEIKGSYKAVKSHLKHGSTVFF